MTYTQTALTNRQEKMQIEQAQPASDPFPSPPRTSEKEKESNRKG